jgi:chaperonin GroES
MMNDETARFIVHRSSFSIHRSAFIVQHSSFTVHRSPQKFPQHQYTPNLIQHEAHMAKGEKTAAVTLKPLDDRIVVQPLEAEEKTAGGIILPDSAKQKPQQGKVVAVGPGKLSDSGSRSPVAVKVGDTVLYGKYSGSDVEVSQIEYKILRESDILAKLTK